MVGRLRWSCGGEDDDVVMVWCCAPAGVVTAKWWWKGGRRVAASECGDRIDRVMGSIFGLGRKIHRKSFSVTGCGAGAAVVVAAGNGETEGRKREIEREKTLDSRTGDGDLSVERGPSEREIDEGEPCPPTETLLSSFERERGERYYEEGEMSATSPGRGSAMPDIFGGRSTYQGATPR
ncbi:hypothetical protein Tco_0426158 [Tanacetum coccineum]